MFGKTKSKTEQKDQSVKSEKKADKKKKLTETGKVSQKIRKTVQQSIPYVAAYPNGVIEVRPNVYSKMYQFSDINFTDATDEDQWSMKEQWGKLLCLFTPDMNVELSIFNRIVDEGKVYNEVLLKPKPDSYNELREAANQIIKAGMQEGRNNLESEKYLTVSFASNSIKEAFNTFQKLETKLIREFSKINENMTVTPVTIAQRLSILFDIYNPYSEVSFDRKFGITKTNGFDLQNLAKAGLSSKDAIGPTEISFKPKMTELGEKFARTVYIDNLPSKLTSDFLCDIANQECSALTSVYFKQLNSKKANTIIQNKMMDISREMMNKQSNASQNGVSAALVSPLLQQAHLDATEFLEEMMNDDQKCFLVTIAMTLFANSEEELDYYEETLKGVAARYVCDIKLFKNQQEIAFDTVLPLADNQVYVDRMMHTESASILIPFSSQELSQEHGQYYGQNAVSKRVLCINKFAFKNANAMFLGSTGSGKSMQAKWEICMSMLGTDDDIYVIDPEDEYKDVANLFPNDAEVIDLKPGATKWINPMDLDIDDTETDGADPIATKNSFIYGLMTTVYGDNFVLNPRQKSILNRCTTELYKPYIKHLETKSAAEGVRVTYDYAAAPTLPDLYEKLMEQDDPDAVQMAIALEMHCQGPNAIFAHKTNINPKKRMLIYSVKSLGEDIKLLGLYTCLNHAWNRMICNQKLGKGTDVYIDEFHLFLGIQSVLERVLSMYKRARKFGGAMRGITQNITDLFSSQDSLKILTACEFVVMMNQKTYERELLANQYNLSASEQSYITNSPSGTGLIYAGKNIYPFENPIPKDSLFYKALSTNCKEKRELEMA